MPSLSSSAGRSAPRPRVAPPSGPTPPDEAVRAYLPLVRWLVQRLAVRKPPQVELDEMVSWGIEGLLDAMRKFDPNKQAAFATYAQFRIRGAILDRLRGMDWVSRSVRQKASVLEKTYRRLEGSLGRPATEEEVAAALELNLPQLHALLSEVGQMSLFSLEDLGVERAQDRWQSRSCSTATAPIRCRRSCRASAPTWSPTRSRTSREGAHGDRALLPRGHHHEGGGARARAHRVARVAAARPGACCVCAAAARALRRSDGGRG
jgi:RNA polymerase sigma factor (sigma-70 family)